jgi:hypothetical protein
VNDLPGFSVFDFIFSVFAGALRFFDMSDKPT